jgi:hypothetical protein
VLTRIELTNFMSHVATVIEPAAGLTVLVGPNNCGKSAIVAALQILCQNPEAKFALRHGTKECSVKVQTDDGHTIVWRRKTAASYDVNGQRFDRLGRGGVPDTLHKVLRLPLVGDEAESDFDIHFGEQKSPIFLLNSSPATAARFFASSSDAIRLVEMQRRHKEKLAERQRQKRDLEAESMRLTAELEQLAPVVDLDRRLKLAFDEYASLLHLDELLQQAERDAAAIAVHTQIVTARRAEHDALGRLQSPPELADPRPLQSLGAALAGAQTALQRATAESLTLDVLPLPPPLFDVATLSRTCQGLSDLTQVTECTESIQAVLLPLAPQPALAEVAARRQLIEQLAGAEVQRLAAESRAAVLHELDAPPFQADAAPLASAIHKLDAAQAQVRYEQQRVAACAAVAPPQADADILPLRDFVSKFSEAQRRVLAAEREDCDAEQQLLAVRTELRQFAATEVCPTCGGPLDAERLLERAALGLGGHGHE